MHYDARGIIVTYYLILVLLKK